MSQQHDIISATTFNPEHDIKYTKTKINKSGGKSVGILNNHKNKPLLISTPPILTWGVNEFVDEQTGKKSYDLALQFPNDSYNTEALTKFLSGIKSFEEKLKQDALKNSKEWLGKPKTSAEVVDALFHPMLKYPKDKNTGDVDFTRPPTLKVKIGYWEDAFNCEVYDYEQKQLFPANDASKTRLMELIPKSCNVAVILRCGGLWFANGKFGCTWKLEQAAVKVKDSLKGKCLIPLDFERKEETTSTTNTYANSSVGLELMNDSDADVDDDEDVEAEAEVEQQVAVKAEVAKVVEAEVEKKTVATKKIIRRKATDS
jgi:hypothetical protein